MSAAYSDSQTSSTQNTTNVDKRVTTDSGDIFTLGDSSLSVANGGTLNFSTNDPATIMAAVDRAASVTETALSQISDTVKTLGAGSNAIASKVAESQEQFVATASGQKWALLGLVVIGVIGLLFLLPKLIKNGK